MTPPATPGDDYRAMYLGVCAALCDVFNAYSKARGAVGCNPDPEIVEQVELVAADFKSEAYEMKIDDQGRRAGIFERTT